jgi:hypothetical protein
MTNDIPNGKGNVRHVLGRQRVLSVSNEMYFVLKLLPNTFYLDAATIL